MSVDMKEVARIREERGISWNELARRVPIDRPSITRWRNGTWNPSLKSAAGIARALDCKLEEIIR